MRGFKFMMTGLIGLAAAGGAVPAQAELLRYHAALDGKSGAEPSGSEATGKAAIIVDTERQTISVDLAVDGIAPDALWDRLVAAPIGPIHLHKYATAAGGESVLVLPLPYGPGYKATDRGMQVTSTDYEYAAGVDLLKSTLSFADFVTALNGGLIVLNIHTDKVNAGEINGRVVGGA